MSIYTWYSDKELLAFCLRKIPARISANEQHARKILYKKKKKTLTWRNDWSCVKCVTSFIKGFALPHSPSTKSRIAILNCQMKITCCVYCESLPSVFQLMVCAWVESCQLSVQQQLANSQPIDGRQMADSWSTGGWQMAHRVFFASFSLQLPVTMGMVVIKGHDLHL